MHRQLSEWTYGSASSSATQQQTSTETPGASPAESRTTSATCRPDISPLAAFGLHDGIRITSAHSAFPATFTEQENSGYLDALSNVKSQDELIRLCNERSAQERTRWRSWWNSQPSSKRLLYFIPVSSTWHILEEDQLECQQLRSERWDILHWMKDNKSAEGHNSEWDAKCRRFDLINKRLADITGHAAFAR